METPERSQTSCLDLLQDKAEEFNFYQAIRVLECVVREEEGIPPIRYKAINEQAFMPNFIAKLTCEPFETIDEFTVTALARAIDKQKYGRSKTRVEEDLLGFFATLGEDDNLTIKAAVAEFIQLLPESVHDITTELLVKFITAMSTGELLQAEKVLDEYVATLPAEYKTLLQSEIDLRNSKKKTEVSVNGFALTGQQGPLPDVYNDMLLEQRAHGNRGPEKFLDLFNNRLLHLLYDIKKQLDPMLFNDISINSELFNILESLTGLTTFDLFKRLPITQEKLLTFSALLIGNRQNYSSIKQVIECMFDCDVEIDPCKGGWRPLPETWQSRLGASNAKLGSGIGLGKKHWDNQAKIGMVLTLKNIDQCRQLMPRGNLHEVLKAMLAYLTDGHYEIDVKLQLDWEYLPESSLTSGSSMFLGQSSWLKSNTRIGKTLNQPKFTVTPNLKHQFWEDVA